MIRQSIKRASTTLDNARMHYRPTAPEPRAIITKLRLERGIRSVRQLALDAGISQPTLTRYLNGNAETMEAASFQALARVLGVTTSELLGEVPLGARLEVREAQAVLTQMSPEQARQWIRLGRALTQEDTPPKPAADPAGR